MNSYKHLDVFMQGRKVGTLAVTTELGAFIRRKNG